MFLKRLLHFFNTLFALLLSVGVVVCVWGMGASRFAFCKGERTFYLHSPSSQAKMQSSLSLLDIARVRGESVLVAEEEGLALIQSLSAEVLFVEDAGGVRSYYCYTPAYYGGLRVGEYLVNLHIAVGEGRCVVGSPIIFGGF